MPQENPSTTELVRAATTGDTSAWRMLVRRYEGLVWSVAREHGLGQADAADVAQATWLTLTQHLGRVRDPERLAGWLATTSGREALRVLALRRREAPSERVLEWPGLAEPGDEPEFAVLIADRDRELWQALTRIPERCQRLLRLVATAPDLTYAQAARALGMLVGTLGPTKTRCLAALRRQLELVGVTGYVQSGQSR